jgi:hypothetical protein
MPDVKKRLVAAGSAMRPPEDPFDRLLKRRDRRRRNQRVAAGAVAGVMALAVLGGGLFALSRIGGEKTGRFGSGPSSPAPALGPGQYFYVKTTVIRPEIRVSSGDGDGYVASEACTAVLESWFATDRSGRLRSQSGSCYGGPEDGTYGPGEFPSGRELAELSTDPAELEAQLEARSASNGASPQPDVTPGGGLPLKTGQLWRAVRALFAFPQAIPELRAAIFEVTANLEGVERIERVKDPVGRDAIELKLTAEERITELFFDPATKQLMAQKERPVNGESGPSYDILESGIVSSVDAPPSDDEWLFPPPVTAMPQPE